MTRYDLIISIFAHTSESVRRDIHQKINRSLRPGGYFILEAYTPLNVGRGIGGPQTVDTCMTAHALREELLQLELLRCEEIERLCQEGLYHKSDKPAAVVQCLAVKR